MLEGEFLRDGDGGVLSFERDMARSIEAGGPVGDAHDDLGAGLEMGEFGRVRDDN